MAESQRQRSIRTRADERARITLERIRTMRIQRYGAMQRSRARSELARRCIDEIEHALDHGTTPVQRARALAALDACESRQRPLL